jgi:hypothetical protein
MCSAPAVPLAFKEASAVFIGTVSDVVDPRSKVDKAPLEQRFYTIRFNVQRSWKGVTSDEISVLSGQGKFGCLSYPAVSKGERYLVFANALYRDGGPVKGLLLIDRCTRTELIPLLGPPHIANRFGLSLLIKRDVWEDVRKLDELSTSTPQPTSNPRPRSSEYFGHSNLGASHPLLP